jgi:hypothetical protein
LYSSPNSIRIIKSREGGGATCGTCTAYRRPFERPRHRWKDNIKMYPKVIGWEVVDWIKLTQDNLQYGLL